MSPSLLRPSMAAVAVVAVAALVWLARPAIPLIDGDVWWHIRAGDEVLRAGSVPDRDTWSIVGQGMPWVSQDWLSNVGLALAYRLGDAGPTVISLAFSLLLVLALVLLWRGIGLREPATGWLSRLVWLTVGLTVAGPAVGVRVQVLDLPLAAASLVVLWRFRAERRARALLWLPLIAVAWANLHAGWLLLFLFGGAVAVGEGLDRLVRRGLAPPPLAWADIGRMTVALVVAAAAISLNPNGPAIYLYPLETSSIAAHRDFLAEWSPPDLGSLPGQLFAGFMLLGVIPALAAGRRRMPFADAFILVGVCVMAATAARFLLIAGPVGAAIVAITLGPSLRASRPGRAIGPTLERMARGPRSGTVAKTNLALAAVLALGGGAIATARVSPSAQAVAVAEHMPVAAVDWIVANAPGTRPFNTYSWGGYLGLRRPDTLVYIDGRSDIYGDGPIRAYADAISQRTDPSLLLDEHRIDHVLFNTDHPFARWLNGSLDWRREYTDPLASVWVREP